MAVRCSGGLVLVVLVVEPSRLTSAGHVRTWPSASSLYSSGDLGRSETLGFLLVLAGVLGEQNQGVRARVPARRMR
jgi:hypothetical protein